MPADPIAAMIVAKGKPKMPGMDGPADGPMAPEDGDANHGKNAACQDIIEAIDKRDAAMLAQALSAFIDMHTP